MIRNLDDPNVFGSLSILVGPHRSETAARLKFEISYNRIQVAMIVGQKPEEQLIYWTQVPMESGKKVIFRIKWRGHILRNPHVI